MEIRLLRLFLDVAATGSFSRAATLMLTTQSSVSKGISQLETELGAPLFQRTGRGATLTDAGRALVPRAEALVADAQALKGLISGLRGSPAGTVRFAVQPSVGWPLAEAVFTAVRRSYPAIRLQFAEGTTHHIEEWLADGRSDLGVMSRPPSAASADAWPLFTIPLLLVSRAGSPVTRTASVPFSALADIPLVVPTAPNGGRLLLEEEARRQNMTLNIAMEANSATLNKRIVATSELCLITSWPSVGAEIAAGTLAATRLVDPVIHQTFHLVLSGRRHPDASVRAVAEIVRRFVPAAEWDATMPPC